MQKILVGCLREILPPTQSLTHARSDWGHGFSFTSHPVAVWLNLPACLYSSSFFLASFFMRWRCVGFVVVTSRRMRLLVYCLRCIIASLDAYMITHYHMEKIPTYTQERRTLYARLYTIRKLNTIMYTIYLFDTLCSCGIL